MAENLQWVDAKNHGHLDAKRRAENGIKTKAHANHVKRKLLGI